MNVITKYSAYVLAFLILYMFTHSCRDEPIEQTNIYRVQAASYSDLFDNFWDEMNNNYNYFFEEDYDWDDVYETYSPKFKKLSTFNDPNADPKTALREINLSFKYFADIISKSRDRHLSIKIKIPFAANKERYGGHKSSYRETFLGGMKYKYTIKDGFIDLKYYSDNVGVNNDIVRKIMKDKLIASTVVSTKKFERIKFLSGALKSDPSIMYINFNKFAIVATKDPIYKLPILKDIGKATIPEGSFKEIKELDAPTTEKFKKRMLGNLDDLYNTLLLILKSNEYKEYLVAREHFLQTEDISKLDAIKDTFDKFVTSSLEGYLGEQMNILRDISKYVSAKKDKGVPLYTPYRKYYEARESFLANSSLVANTDNGSLNLGALLKSSFDICGGLYKNLLNPLTKGEVKKLIIDLRGNKGGEVRDVNYFISRFVNKEAIWGYYRTKEGDGRFNYGPWLPSKIEPHKFGTPKAIPTVILLDKVSASMSEISSIMLKSQGDHVKIIGDNSSGAIAILGNQDDFNGGARTQGKYIRFYMPMMAYKTVDGKIIEGEGITPDIKVIPTKEEVEKMETTKNDPVFNRALEEIRKMTVK